MNEFSKTKKQKQGIFHLFVNISNFYKLKSIYYKLRKIKKEDSYIVELSHKQITLRN